jgi:hypothetical protein
MLGSGYAVAYATEGPTETGESRDRHPAAMSDSRLASEDAGCAADIVEGTPW